MSITFGSAVLLGCPNPNLYATPRTLPRGKAQVIVSGDAVVLPYTDTRGVSQSIVTAAPAVQVRAGLAKSFDVGGKLTTGGIGADLKWNFVRGEIDVALDPAVQLAASNNGVEAFYVHLPLLIGTNVGEHFTAYASPGVVGYLRDGNYGLSDGVVPLNGVGARVGVGIQVRVTPFLALTPEATAMRFFNRGDSVSLNAGLGLSFGAQPDYAPKPVMVQREEPNVDRVEEIEPPKEQRPPLSAPPSGADSPSP